MPERLRHARWGLGIAFVAVLALGWWDALLPPRVSLDFLYLLPIYVATRAGGMRSGFLLALLAALGHGAADSLLHPGGLTLAAAILDTLLRALGLAGIALLFAQLLSGLKREKEAARTDLLTGLTNRKAFIERLEQEIERSRRYARPLSLAYLDLDGFKGVNDRFGHAAGDQVLRTVAGVLRTSLRGHDLPARIGGDEFAVVLPETDAEPALRVMERLRTRVEEHMRDFDWPVTCSVGVVTAPLAQLSLEEIIRRADDLMYQVKHEGKNALRQEVVGSRIQDSGFRIQDG